MDHVERGDRVRVLQDGEEHVTGTVEAISSEWGRRALTIRDDDGTGWTVWDRADREIEVL